MKIVLYSDHTPELDTQLIRLTNKKKPSITYLEHDESFGLEYFDTFKHAFKSQGINRIECKFASMPAEDISSDILFIDGGNTFDLMKNIRRNGWEPIIRRFATDGVLGVASAGGIILSNTLDMARVPKSSADKNTVKLKNMNGLGIIDFDFCPHYHPRHNNELLKHVSKSKTPILCCNDSSGIVINNKVVRFIGNTTIIGS